MAGACISMHRGEGFWHQGPSGRLWEVCQGSPRHLGRSSELPGALLSALNCVLELQVEVQLMEEMRCSALVATFRARISQGNSPERIQDSAEGPHGSLSTYCRLLLLLAPSRALAAPSRGGST